MLNLMCYSCTNFSYNFSTHNNDSIQRSTTFPYSPGQQPVFLMERLSQGGGGGSIKGYPLAIPLGRLPVCPVVCQFFLISLLVNATLPADTFGPETSYC